MRDKMKFALLLLTLIPGFAMADARYECVPLTANKSLVKAVVLDIGPSYELELWGPSGLISKTAAEYEDDVDAVSYFSESANANVWFFWAEMQEDGEAEGQIVLEYSANKRESIDAHCKSL